MQNKTIIVKNKKIVAGSFPVDKVKISKDKITVPTDMVYGYWIISEETFTFEPLITLSKGSATLSIPAIKNFIIVLKVGA